MSEPRRDQGFPDCVEFWDKALDSDKGWKVVFAEKGHATNFRLRCYGARRRMLKFNAQVYGEGDLMKRKTVWDAIVLHIRQVEDGWAVLAVKGLESIAVRQGPI